MVQTPNLNCVSLESYIERYPGKVGKLESRGKITINKKGRLFSMWLQILLRLLAQPEYLLVVIQVLSFSLCCV
jgi:hypothetical protein